MKRVRQVLPSRWHSNILDNYDQDHAMILGEGTKGLIYQSIMLKPPNVQPVFPIRDESKEMLTTIKLSKKALIRKGPVIIFNTELLDSRNIIGSSDRHYFHKILDSIKNLSNQLEDFDVIVVYDDDQDLDYEVKVALGSLGMSNLVALPASDPFNIEFDLSTETVIQENERQIYWIGQCTQQNFLIAFEKFKARFIGFADREMSHTQTYNCHKLQTFNVGKYFDLALLDK